MATTSVTDRSSSVQADRGFDAESHDIEDSFADALCDAVFGPVIDATDEAWHAGLCCGLDMLSAGPPSDYTATQVRAWQDGFNRGWAEAEAAEHEAWLDQFQAHLEAQRGQTLDGCDHYERSAEGGEA